MALLALYGGIGTPRGDYSGKAAQPEVIADTAPDGAGAGAKLYKRKKYPRKIIIGGKVYTVRSLAEERALLAEYAAAQQAKLDALQDREAPTEQVRVQKIRVTKARQRVARVENQEDAWLARLRQEDEEILLLLH